MCVTLYDVAGKRFRVHIDGYNLLAFLMGKEAKSPRKGFDDDGDLVALRFDNRKLVFMEQRRADNSVETRSGSDFDVIRGLDMSAPCATHRGVHLFQHLIDHEGCDPLPWRKFLERRQEFLNDRACRSDHVQLGQEPVVIGVRGHIGALEWVRPQVE